MPSSRTISLDGEEGEMLRAILAKVVIEKRTGQLGILHGADRFVSMQIVLRKEGLALLDGLARKAGLPSVTAVDR